MSHTTTIAMATLHRDKQMENPVKGAYRDGVKREETSDFGSSCYVVQFPSSVVNVECIYRPWKGIMIRCVATAGSCARRKVYEALELYAAIVGAVVGIRTPSRRQGSFAAAAITLVCFPGYIASPSVKVRVGA